MSERSPLANTKKEHTPKTKGNDLSPVSRLPAGETNVADRGRASGLYRVGITGTGSHASPFTKWS